jgi:mannosyltransferase
MSKDPFLLNKGIRNGFGIQKHFSSGVLLGIILFLGIILRFYDLGAENYYGDEMYTVIEAQQSVHQLLTSGRLDQPPTYYLPLLLWVKIFGTTEVSTRSFSALAGVGSIILIYLIGRELFGKRIGLLSAFLMATSVYQIQVSQIARYYSLYEFTILLSFLFFITAFRSKRITHFALYGVTSIIMVYSHAFGIFILAAQNLYFILQWKKVRNVIITWFFCQALIVLAIIPYFYPLIFGGNMVETARSNSSPSLPPLLSPLISLYKFIIPFRFDRSWGTIIGIWIVSIAFLVTGTWIYANRLGKRNWVAAARGLVGNLQEVPNMTSELFLVGCWLLCPIMLPFILSWVVFPMYTDKYVIGAATALYLLIALGMLSIRKVVPLMVSLGALLIMIVPGLHYYYVTDIRDQWKEVAVYIEENSGSNDVIVFVDNRSVHSFEIKQKLFYWYYQGTLQSCNLDLKPIDPASIMKPLMQCLSGHDRFWLISHSYYQTDIDRINSLFINPNQTTVHLIKERQFVEISVYYFELTK